MKPISDTMYEYCGAWHVPARGRVCNRTRTFSLYLDGIVFGVGHE